jgi:hypothetical protein
MTVAGGQLALLIEYAHTSSRSHRVLAYCDFLESMLWFFRMAKTGLSKSRNRAENLSSAVSLSSYKFGEISVLRCSEVAKFTNLQIWPLSPIASDQSRLF